MLLTVFTARYRRHHHHRQVLCEIAMHWDPSHITVAGERDRRSEGEREER